MLSRTALIINRRIISTTTVNSQKISSRSLHISHRINSTIITRHSTLKLTRYSPILSSSFVRCLSTDDSSQKTESLGAILQTAKPPVEGAPQIPTNNIVENVTPEVITTTNIVESIPPGADVLPVIPEVPVAPPVPPPEALETLSVLAEPTLKSLGLGSWWPSGIIQQLFELVHVNLGVPWWGTIIIGTICVRTLMFPLIILSQKNAANMHNTMPGMQKIQQKITDARVSGDQLGIARETKRLMDYMKLHNCNPVKAMIVPMCQAPVFLSFFLALRGMAKLPVDSMKTGGLFWFENLTVPDPYYLLPVITAGTLALTIKLGMDTPQVNSMGWMKYVVNAVPIFILPFMINFPAALTFYWTITNLYGMGQVFLLKIPAVREYFKIQTRLVHPPDALMKPKKFKEGFKESWTNMKLAREMTAREQIDVVQFNKAGRGPLQKTYSYNPVQEHLKKTQVMAKKS
ncbi:mitochondrial inner membrane protein OXA1L [Fopius arisanus]|uniref:Mitochondrial inner membrane protein OXA1L n=1 Tax=Fopius arisanus TaxID=64838 RepID=A0A9R1TUP0_9HYME|nr:PREDICTED: mitochondrial inner membrane protein OXA1L [Fopius arisanus]